MFRLALLLFTLTLPGCSYVQQRLWDGADMFRLEGSAGYGLQVHANIGEVAHIGFGSSRRYVSGFHYGFAHTQWVSEDHIPMSFIWTMMDSDNSYLHHIHVEEDPKAEHYGYMALPGEINRDEWDKREIFYGNLEVGFHALIVGGEVGFSIGEFFDFLLGLFKFSDRWTWMDIGDDDLPAQREKRAMYKKRVRKLRDANKKKE